MGDRMNEQQREAVSALVDGEASELEVRRLLRSDHADEVAAIWTRHQRVRSLMRREDQRFGHLDISAQVMARLEAEPALRRRPHWWKPAGGVAVAASVAALVVFGLAPPEYAGSASPQVAASSPVYPVQMAPAQRAAQGNVAVSAMGQYPLVQRRESLDDDAVMQQRMDRLLLRHTEQAALNSGEGIISFARVASFDAP